MYYKQTTKNKVSLVLLSILIQLINGVGFFLCRVRFIRERVKILHSCHVDPTNGHLGKTRIIYRIKEWFMWHGIVKDVNRMVSCVMLKQIVLFDFNTCYKLKLVMYVKRSTES